MLGILSNSQDFFII